MVEHLKDHSDSEPSWHEVLCWFGSACWPEAETYRVDMKSGRVQVEAGKDWHFLETDEQLKQFLDDINWATPDGKATLSTVCYTI